ncbi:MAG: response regulator [Bdellovibrionota bacterium]|nr:response regulator [Bdellovibrionota bacterium]
MKKSDFRMLVVDDEPELLEILSEYFELKDFNVFTAESGNKALEFLDKEKVDFVLSDIRMPDGDGIYLVKSLRAIDEKEPVIYLYSGQIDKNSLSTDEDLLMMGVQKLIKKPFATEEIEREIVNFFNIED